MKYISKILLVSILLIFNLLYINGQSTIEIIRKENLLTSNNKDYSKKNSYDFSILNDGKELSEWQFAKLTNDKRMVNRIEWHIYKPQKTRTAGKVVFVTGLLAIVVPSIKIAFKGHSETYWENGVIVTGVIGSIFSVGMMKYKDEYNVEPDHYYHIDQARKRAEVYNFNKK